MKGRKIAIEIVREAAFVDHGMEPMAVDGPHSFFCPPFFCHLNSFAPYGRSQMVLPSKKAFQVTCHSGRIFFSTSIVLNTKKIPTE
jgi:hypothetical protein